MECEASIGKKRTSATAAAQRTIPQKASTACANLLPTAAESGRMRSESPFFKKNNPVDLKNDGGHPGGVGQARAASPR